MCLRVLDLHCTGIKNVPSSIGKLKHLRYLDLSANEMTELAISICKLQNLQTLKLSSNEMTTLPISICKLQNLQTLELSYNNELRELPIDTRKLISLRHLEIYGCGRLTHMPFGLGELTSLRTLPLFVVGKEISVSNRRVGGIGELNGLNHLRGTLMITCLENMRHGGTSSGSTHLKAKQYLRFLALQWKPYLYGAEDADANYTAVLEDLQPHPNLKRLDIEGYGGLSFPVWMTVTMVSSLPYLVQINLDNCRKCKHLPWFGQLPFLEYLQLSNLSSLEYIHDNSTVESSSSSHPSSSLRGTGAFFPSLQELSLHTLPLLKEWCREVVVIANADDMEIAPAALQKVSLLSFPRLANLEVQDCRSLISVPLLPSLEKLTMSSTSEKLLQSMTTRVIETDSHITTTTTIDYSSIPSSPLPSLKTLDIWGWGDLVSLPEEAFQNLTSLQHLSIGACPKLVHLPEEGFRGLTSLQSLCISYCKSLTSISLSPDLTALQKLEISSCDALNWWWDFDVSLPHGLQHLTALQVLDISCCDDLVALPEWIGNLESLRSLHIRNCPKLGSLPDAMSRLTALKELHVDDCGILSARCRMERSTELPKIAHIPKIRINGKRM